PPSRSRAFTYDDATDSAEYSTSINMRHELHGWGFRQGQAGTAQFAGRDRSRATAADTVGDPGWLLPADVPDEVSSSSSFAAAVGLIMLDQTCSSGATARSGMA